MSVEKTGNFIRRYSIETPSELEMAVFCIEELARRNNTTGDKTYRALTKVLPNNLTVLDSYIIPVTEFFRTQGRNYILAEISETMNEWGVSL